MKNVIATIACTAAIIASILFSAHAIIDAMPEQFECDTCGAHVTDVWYVRSDSGELIHVCERCEIIAEQEDAANGR